MRPIRLHPPFDHGAALRVPPPSDQKSWRTLWMWLGESADRIIENAAVQDAYADGGADGLAQADDDCAAKARLAHQRPHLRHPRGGVRAGRARVATASASLAASWAASALAKSSRTAARAS